MGTQGKNGLTIQSVERALAILEEFSVRERELGVTEIAKRVGLNKSTCFNLINTLLQKGYLEQNPDNGKYRLSLKIFQLGKIYEAGLELREIAKPFLQELVDKTGETVHLVIRDRREAVYYRKSGRAQCH
ncbi:IclR family transcriptional regulator [Thermanaerosceptrum fracticalcis]|uniref:IclR family transcriptional regulator n=1 Tax=Thermanaerosceptrum fracticalcis TaxID=1712410 RepID=UPI001A9B0912|nr:IclR family transcriptional regulator [Thermanaerosceptrum fracticalcis]